MPRRRQPLRLRAGHHVQGGQLHRGRRAGITPEAYRQRLSRAHKTVAEFLGAYCQHGGAETCSCERRVNFAIATHRLAPHNLEYLELTEEERAQDAFVDAMDEMDGYASLFDRLPSYRPTPRAKELLEACMGTASFDAVVNAGKEASHA